jgi:hypothetical protein
MISLGSLPFALQVVTASPVADRDCAALNMSTLDLALKDFRCCTAS